MVFLHPKCNFLRRKQLHFYYKIIQNNLINTYRNKPTASIVFSWVSHCLKLSNAKNQKTKLQGCEDFPELHPQWIFDSLCQTTWCLWWVTQPPEWCWAAGRGPCAKPQARSHPDRWTSGEQRYWRGTHTVMNPAAFTHCLNELLCVWVCFSLPVLLARALQHYKAGLWTCAVLLSPVGQNDTAYVANH